VACGWMAVTWLAVSSHISIYPHIHAIAAAGAPALAVFERAAFEEAQALRGQSMGAELLGVLGKPASWVSGLC
jgi:hypothetical protein